MIGDFQYWHLLLIPVFFTLGWAAARIDIKHLVKESRELPRSYFEGLNFLLKEQPDRAIEAFCEVVRVDPETIELHFALGNLFRRRGEIERAIRMHQNLLDRDDLSADLKLEALAELGHDYLKVGLLDRAEEIFNKLRDTPRDEDAKRELLEIYQLEKNWEKAIKIAEELPGFAMQKDIAHYHCELAEKALRNSRTEEAKNLLETALALHRQCVRASMLLGDLKEREGNDEAAITCWQRIEQQNPTYLSLVAQRMLEAYRRLDQREEGLQIIQGYLEHYPSLDLLDSVFQLVFEAEGAENAYRLLRIELKRNPTLLGLDKLLEARLLAFPNNEGRADFELAKSIIHTQTHRLARFQCNNCGFKARQFYWRCPACGGWETYPPRRTEEFNTL